MRQPAGRSPRFPQQPCLGWWLVYIVHACESSVLIQQLNGDKQAEQQLVEAGLCHCGLRGASVPVPGAAPCTRWESLTPPWSLLSLHQGRTSHGYQSFAGTSWNCHWLNEIDISPLTSKRDGLGPALKLPSNYNNPILLLIRFPPAFSKVMENTSTWILSRSGHLLEVIFFCTLPFSFHPRGRALTSFFSFPPICYTFFMYQIMHPKKA